VFSELAGTGAVKVDAFRRNLQRAYVELMADRLNGRQPANDDQRPFVRGELRALATQIAAPRVAGPADRATQLHLDDLKDQIAKALDPKFQAAAPSAAGAATGRPGVDEPSDPTSCWPDYIVRRQP
jgi:hypothetical protein